ncbi:MAG: EAL domain-containing protein [Thiomonas sp.]
MLQKFDVVSTDGMLEPYGPEAASLLRKTQHHIAPVAARFADTFYSRLAESPAARAILATLGAQAMLTLKSNQTAHLQFLLSPDTTQAQIVRRAEALGRIHALVGVTSSLLVQSLAIYRHLLSAHLKSTPLAVKTRYWLSLIMECRLQDDIQVQLEAAERVVAAYSRALSRVFPNLGVPWSDASAAEIEVLGALPGIHGAMLMRLNQEGVLTVERSAGPGAPGIVAVLQGSQTSILIDPGSPRGQGLVAVAWRTLQAQSSPSYARDPRVQFWAEHARRLKVQSTLALPILDDAGHAVACVYLYGSFPNQFESDWMREFGRGLQRRWEQTWQRCRTKNHCALPETIANDYRQQMFSGGLVMYGQPIVDLHTGEIPSVEILARLRLQDGTIVAPGKFLPLLGNVELDQLFRDGLDQALQWLTRWDAEKVPLSISINLSPSTLLNPDSRQWIGDALRRYGVAPHRLSVELLETLEMDSAAQSEATQQLKDLGVRLSMDDLGSGYSNLERLCLLPFDVVKIDQGLLATMRTNPMRVLSLVGALVQVARDLEREVVVEGLEDDDMIEAVAVLGASFGQGYGFARPMPLDAVAQWIRRFKVPTQSGRIHTELGALAYHWQYMHSGNPPTPETDLETCPLTSFFGAYVPHDVNVERWHAQIHAGSDPKEASRLLTEWLVAKVQMGTG